MISTYQRARKLHKVSKYKQAFKMYLKGIKEGDEKCYYGIALFYDRGYGIEVDKAKAHDIFVEHYDAISTLADNGDSDAMLILAFYTNNGFGNIDKDIDKYTSQIRVAAEHGNAEAQYALYVQLGEESDEAKEWLVKAADGGYIDAQIELGMLYQYGKNGIDKDYTKAKQWCERASVQGSAFATAGIGAMYDSGNGVDINYETAVKYYEKAIKMDRTEQYPRLRFAEALYQGKGIEKDEKRAFLIFKKLYKEDCVDVCADLANCYRDGKVVRKNLKKAIELYLEHDNGTDAEFGTFQIGNMYAYGEGVKQNFKKAIEYYNKVVDGNNIFSNLAKREIANLYGKDMTNPKDVNKKIEILKTMPDDCGALCDLSTIYCGDYSIEKDEKKAFDYMMQALKVVSEELEGFVYIHLGYFYKNGIGTDIDYQKAMSYFVKATNIHNDVDANIFGYNHIADMYEKGLGVDVDLNQAISNWQKALELGSGYAAYNIGYCYFLGNAVEKDYDKAREYFEIAKEKDINCNFVLNLINRDNEDIDNTDIMNIELDEIMSKNLTTKEAIDVVNSNLMNDFGDLWDRLQEETKTLLMTGVNIYTSLEIMYREFKSVMDFSSAIMPMIKGFEVEMKRIFYIGYLNYLIKNNVSITEFNDEKSFIMQSGPYTFSYKDPIKSSYEFTLGSVKYIIGANKMLVPNTNKITYRKFDNNIVIKINNIDELYDKKQEEKKHSVDTPLLKYMMEIFKEDSFSEKFREEEVEAYLISFAAEISDITRSLRNKAAHTELMTEAQAATCGNYLFKNRKLMVDIMSKIDYDKLDEYLNQDK